MDGRTYKIQLWDTAGEAKFKTITQAYFKNTRAALFVYDVTSAESFEQVKQSIKEFLMSENPFMKYMGLVGNKKDLPKEVSSESGMSLAGQ